MSFPTFPGARRVLAASVFALGFASASAAGASEQPVATACAQSGLFSVIDSASGLPAACPLEAGSFLADSLYYQNASRVGGTALAAYPMMHLAAGISDRGGIVLDAPSQIAESGLRGAGLYPGSSPGIGLTYALSETSRTALGIGVESRPPLSPFATTTAQGRYDLDVTSLYRLSPAFSFDGFASELMARTRTAARLLPTLDLGLGYDVAPNTQISTDLGSRGVAARARRQSFGDVSVTRTLRKNLALDTGLGTAFNAVSNAKAHYLSAGLDFKN